MNRGARIDANDANAASARAVDASAGTRCRCCGDESRARGRTICVLCVQADCRLSLGCYRTDDEA